MYRFVVLYSWELTLGCVIFVAIKSLGQVGQLFFQHVISPTFGALVVDRGKLADVPVNQVLFLQNFSDLLKVKRQITLVIFESQALAQMVSKFFILIARFLRYTMNPAQVFSATLLGMFSIALISKN